MEIKRRDLLKVGMAGMGTLLVPQGLLAQLRPRVNEDHFFVQIILQGGADFSYLFDARPLSMTAAGKIQNYIGEEPIPYAGINGGRTFRTKLTAPMMAHQQRFSVINGVLMATNFEGHGQNMNYFLTGNPFGGESFVPHLNWEPQSATPLDGVMSGFSFATVSNNSSIVPMDPEAVGGLTGMLNTLPVLNPQEELAAHMRRRLQANATGAGRFSTGSRQMLSGFDGLENLHVKMKQLQPSAAEAAPEVRFVDLIAQLFRLKISRSALWIFNEQFDTHDPRSAQAQPVLFQGVMDKIAKVFELLAATPFDAKRSMLDVTTIMVNSEFGRTMRITNSPIDQTGTNHNPLCNSVLIGGKGIRGGQVLGASDFAVVNEVLSGAHLALEPRMESVMGRPFDFSTGKPRQDLPASFAIENYLTINSVVNSVYTLFGVNSRHFRTLSRGGPPAPVVPGLLA